MTTTMEKHADVVEFWSNAGPDRWFTRDAAFDSTFHDSFRDLHFAAARRELDHWADHANGALALIILLDQFPRNCFRGTAHMFATDPLARYIADKAIEAGHDDRVDPELRVFMYLPFEHSESIADQYRSVELAQKLDESYMPYALEHRDIIQRFGRFPHRNPALGRETTPEEQAYLDSGGFAG
ncbi:DUF924 family protein [Pseudaminobacter salicylatoxidans]|uniref:DUF924 family protein n=1 Tax=Pseudaminobacter salicylatoxidans TaxID=93369 RepID=UPI0002ED90F8|nr:DUF924 family protein [Pseudaminobacter salicylatoxidans]